VEELEALAVQLVDDPVFAAESGIDIHRAHAGCSGDPPDGQRARTIDFEEPAPQST
jgi:hypothetical protein